MYYDTFECGNTRSILRRSGLKNIFNVTDNKWKLSRTIL